MSGGLAAVGAFVLWGLFPIYWKLLDDFPAVELIAHRVVWSLLFLLVIVPLRGGVGQVLSALRTPRHAGLYLLSGLLLAVNWLIFVYAVVSGQIIASSLGYFLNPLCNVILGALFLRERLRPVQWFAVGLAAIGVLVQVVQVGRLPWISLALAVTFAVYGLLRKQGPLGSLTGLAVETTLLAPMAVGYLVILGVTGGGLLGVARPGQLALLICMGVVTATPLLLFATAARKLTLSTLGLIQYLSPTGQLLVGALLYDEPFDREMLLSFAFIWAGLILYTADSLRAGRRRAPPAPPEAVPLSR